MADAENTGPQPRSKPSRRRLTPRRALFWAGMLCVAAIGTAGFYPLTFSKNSGAILKTGEEAAERGERLEAERISCILEFKGDLDAARLIRGKLHLAEARSLDDQLHQNREHVQTARADFGLGWGVKQSTTAAGTLGPLPGVELLWTPLVTHHLLALNRRELANQLSAHIQHASHQLSSIPPDSPLFDRAMLPAAEAAIRLRESGGVIPLEPVYRLLASVTAGNPDNLNAQRWLAIVCLDLNLKEEAISALRAVGRLDPADGRAHRTLGLLLSAHAHVGAAMEAYREALGRKLEPNVRAEAAIELARLEVKHGVAARALATLARIPQPFGDDPDCLTIRAAALVQIGSEDGRREAARLLERVLNAQPRHVEALVTLAQMRFDEERTKEAIGLLERSLEVSLGDEDVHSRLALAYRQIGDPTRAEQHARRADEVREGKKRLSELVSEARRDVANADLRVRAAEICVQLQRWREARVWLRAALACDPHHSDARSLLRRVENEQRTAQR